MTAKVPGPGNFVNATADTGAAPSTRPLTPVSAAA